MYGLVGFSRSQTNGFMIFLPLLLLILFSEPLYRALATGIKEPPNDRRKLDSLLVVFRYDKRSVTTSALGFYQKLDPNTAPIESLISVGMSEKLAKRIVAYRQTGGKFYKNSDLLRIYGMDSASFDKINRYITIAEIPSPKRIRRSSRPQLTRNNINDADTAAFKSVFGIGEKLSLRIIKYRDALGGFVKIDQLKEVYNLDTAVIGRISLRFEIKSGFKPKQLSINNAGRQELAAHPYIRGKVADAIVAYRFQHGPYKEIKELRNITIIDSVAFNRMFPYLQL